MSFSGDLEHLSIVDVVQLLHSTRKSGTLTITGSKGECQLVFDDGYITSANHFDNSLRIGRILVEAGAITAGDLERTLAEQAAARSARKPLVAALIESGRVKKDAAYRGLETLLELTIVEVLTWPAGRFVLDVGRVTAADDYRYFPEKLDQGIRFHTESVLLDALRIYDEKKREGTLAEQFEITDKAFDETFGGGMAGPAADGQGDGQEKKQPALSADDLGLGDVDRLDRKIPEVFKPLADRSPAGAQRRALAALAPGLPGGELDRLAALLEALPPLPRRDDGPPLSVILYGSDDLFAHCASTACRHEGIPVFSTSEERDLDPVVAQYLAKGGVPVLVLDTPAAAVDRFTPEALAELRRRKRAMHPGLCTIQLAAPGGPVLPGSPAEGVVAVFARPARDVPRAAFVDALGAFLAAFPSHLRAHAHGHEAWVLARVRDGLAAVQDVRDGPSVALALLRSVARACERALMLVVRGRELLAERGIGFAGPEREPQLLQGPSLRLPAGSSPLLEELLDGGRSRLVDTSGDEALRLLHARLGAPHRPLALLVPLRAVGTTVSLIYADFGRREPDAVDLDLIETLAAQAGLALERVIYRRRAQKTAP